MSRAPLFYLGNWTEIPSHALPIVSCCIDSIVNRMQQSLGPNLEFLGAAGTVTGSRTLLTFDRTKILIDCGLFQGPRELRYRNWEAFPLDPSQISRLILTHAHLDHTGYIPKLVKEGFRGEILCSQGTAALCEVLWYDSAKLQEEDASYANRTGHSKHKPAMPLYGRNEVDESLKLLRVCKRDEWIPLSKSMSFKFKRAGHIPGACFVEFYYNEGQSTKKFCFSGDLGHDRSLTIREPDFPDEADTLILESTYGDRRHSQVDLLAAAEKIFNETFLRKGVVVIPAFSVGRAQEVLKLIQILESQNRIPCVPVILDSPMSIRATDIYLKEVDDIQPGGSFVRSAQTLFPRNYSTAGTPDESFAACMTEGPAVIISASGMLNGGRILHHLKQRIQDERNTVLFVGYQAEGTKGRYLLEIGSRAGSMRIHHQEVPVKAQISMIDGLSAHGDYQDLTKWILKFKRVPKKIILNHGEEVALDAFKKHLESTLKVSVEIARPDTVYRI